MRRRLAKKSLTTNCSCQFREKRRNCLMITSVCPSLSPPLSLSVSPFACPSVRSSLCLSVCPSRPCRLAVSVGLLGNKSFHISCAISTCSALRMLCSALPLRMLAKFYVCATPAPPPLWRFCVLICTVCAFRNSLHVNFLFFDFAFGLALGAILNVILALLPLLEMLSKWG